MLKEKLLFNPSAKEDIKVINGETSNILDLANIPKDSEVFHKLFDQAYANNWLPHKVPMGNDSYDYKHKMTDEDRNGYDLVISFLAFLDSLQTNNLPNLSSYITNPHIVYSLTRQAYDECLVGDTEVLTPKGWIRLDSYSGESVLQFDKDKNKSSFVKPKRVIKNYREGYINKFEGNRFSQYVTDGHRMLYKNREETENRVKEACDFFEGTQGVSFITSTKKEGKVDSLTDFDKFLIALQADGSVRREYTNKNGDIKFKNRNGKRGYIVCSFSFAKERKIIRLTNLLDKLGFKYKVNNLEQRGQKKFIVKVPTKYYCTKNFNEWVDITDKSYIWAREFLNELKCWDGWDYAKPTFGYDTTDFNNAEIVQMIGSISGWNVSNNIKYDKRGYKPVYRLSFKRDSELAIRGTVVKKREPFKGMVYCLEVDTGFFVIRHKGKVSVTGNCLHSKSYGWIFNSIMSKEKSEYLYNLWKTSPLLLERNKFIANIYQAFKDTPNEENFIKALIGNYMLEGIYFYNGFALFHTFSNRNMMIGSDTQIRYIKRDELNHTVIFENIIKLLFKENPSYQAKYEKIIYDMFKEAVNWEIEFSKDAIGNKILGMSEKSIEDNAYYLGNKRLNKIGYDKIFIDAKNPYVHLDKLAGVEDETTNRTNNFEAKSINYKSPEILNDWDKL